VAHPRKDLIREYHGYSAVLAVELTVLACFQEDPARTQQVIVPGKWPSSKYTLSDGFNSTTDGSAYFHYLG
jgi:hypothetical protein